MFGILTWHSQNNGPNYFCPGSFFWLARFTRDFSSAREFPSPVAASPWSRKSPPFLWIAASRSASPRSRSSPEFCRAPVVHEVAEFTSRGKEEFARGRGVLAGNYRSAWRGRARQGVQETRDIKFAKPLCLCKNAKFGPSNAKFAKMHK